MSQKNKIQVIDDEDELSLSYRWYHPKVFFFLFFSIFWNAISFGAFLGAGAAAGTGVLFMLPFLAIGMGMAYYTGALFVNKTSLSVSEEFLTVGAGPLPWPGTKKIPVGDLKQLYVKQQEHYNQEQGTTYYTYQLRAKLEGEIEENLMVLDEADAKVVKVVEQKIEKYLGITDYKIKGEFQALEKKTIKELPRHEGRRVLPSEAGIQNLKLGSFADYGGATYEVRHQTQYDWSDGNTDKLLQLVDHKNTELLTFIHQNKGIFTPFIEVQMSLGEIQNLNFDPNSNTSELNYQDNLFLLEKHQKGKHFLQNNLDSTNLEQWLYLDKSESYHLRILLKEDGTQTAFFGKKESDAIFDNLTIV